MLAIAALPCRDEYGANETYRSAVTGKFGPGYGPVEAQVLHAVVRHFRPRRIIEVGSGVVLHVHDIYLPYDYSPMSFKTLWHWNETAFLHALLIHNRRMKTLFCLSLLHHDRREVLREVFPGYDPEPMTDGLVTDAVGPLEYPSRHFPCATYLQITG